VALQLAARMIIQGIAESENLGDQSITYAGPATDLTTGEAAIVQKYRTR